MSTLNSNGVPHAFGHQDARQADPITADTEGFSCWDHPGDDQPDLTPASPPERARAAFTRMSDVTLSPVNWLWPGFIAIGKLTMVVGDPGVGKSFLSLDLAARVTIGKSWPDGTPFKGKPGSVILVSSEDGLGDTIKPRLAAAGADMERVIHYEGPIDANGEPQSFNLRRHIPNLKAFVEETGDAKLIVIDPLTAFGGGVDDRNHGAVREMMQPLADMAAKLGVAVLVISHLNKNDAGRAVYRAAGSVGFTAVARAVWLVVKDAKDGERKLFLSIKNNLAAPKGLAYRIVDAKLEWEPDPITMSADEAMGAESRARHEPGMVEKAAAFLEKTLADGAMRSESLFELGEAEGFSRRSVERGKGHAGIGDKRLKARDGMRTFWHLPGSPPSSIDDCQGEEPTDDSDNEIPF